MIAITTPMVNYYLREVCIVCFHSLSHWWRMIIPHKHNDRLRKCKISLWPTVIDPIWVYIPKCLTLISRYIIVPSTQGSGLFSMPIVWYANIIVTLITIMETFIVHIDDRILGVYVDYSSLSTSCLCWLFRQLWLCQLRVVFFGNV